MSIIGTQQSEPMQGTESALSIYILTLNNNTGLRPLTLQVRGAQQPLPEPNFTFLLQLLQCPTVKEGCLRTTSTKLVTFNLSPLPKIRFVIFISKVGYIITRQSYSVLHVTLVRSCRDTQKGVGSFHYEKQVSHVQRDESACMSL